jgi:hypothetical protein
MKFLQFIEKITTPDNKSLIETIQNGYLACFESAVTYSGEDYFIKKYLNEIKRKIFFSDDIPLTNFTTEEEALRQIIEEWKKKKDLYDDELEFILSTNPKATVLGNTVVNLTKHPAWNMIRKQAKIVFKDRIDEIENRKAEGLERYKARKFKTEKAQAPMSEFAKLINDQEKLKQHKFERLDRNLQRFAEKELA